MLEQYIEFDIAGQPGGGLLVGRTPVGAGQQIVVNELARNTQRVAYALWWYGREWGRPDWQQKASYSLAWSLAAPQDHGLFPTAYDLHTARWQRSYRSTEHYDVAACAWTARWLLRWHDDLLNQPAILDFVRQFTDAIVAAQDAAGHIAGQLDSDLAPTRSSSPATSIFALLLAELAQVTGEQRYSRALVPTCNALIADLVEGGASDEWQVTTGGLALLKAYRLTGDAAHLRAGVQLSERLAQGAGIAQGDNTPGTSGDAIVVAPELYAAAYRLTMDPRYAEDAVAVLRRAPAQPEHLAGSSWDQANALACRAILEAQYPDVLALTDEA